MMRFIIAFLLAIFVLSCKTAENMMVTSEEKDDDTFKIVAYLPKYTATLADHIDAFDFTKVTHINIAFFNPDSTGNFHSSQGTGLDQIVTKAHQHNVKVLLSIGGGSLRPNYTDLLKDENRAAFVDKVVALVSLYGVDGIDVDLEGDNIDENYNPFITDLSAQLKPAGKLLTAAVAWWTRARINDAALNAFDFINVMAYDKAGAEHSPYDYATQHLGYWKGERGLPASKIVVGVPFYGWYTQDGALKEMNYKTLIAQYPGAEYKDEITRVEDGLVVNYNGIPTIQNKTAYALAEASGIMFWQVLQDQPGPLSLLKAIHDKIDSNKGWKNPYITWRYGLGTATNNEGTVFASSSVDKFSNSVKGTPGFLPFPPYGTSRVFLPANSGANFELQGIGDARKLKMIAASTGAPAKFSWYNIAEATPIAALSFTLDLDASVTNGQLIIPFGYSTNVSSTFNNTGQLTNTVTAGVFGAIRLDFYGGNIATLSYRNSTPGYTVINNNVFDKTGNYQIELYCNNDVVEQKYVKGGVTYTLPSQTFNIWVNDVAMQIASNSLKDFPATGELDINQVVNSFSVNLSGNTGTPTSTPPTTANSLIATIDNISLDFAFKTGF